MAERQNKFLAQYKRNKTATDDFVDQLYEDPSETPEKKSNMDVEPEVVTQKPVDEVVEDVAVNTVPVKEKKKVGRPRKTNEERSIFNVKLSVSEKEMLNVASAATGKSRVDYLVDLLKADYAKNQEYYDMVKSNIYK